MKRNEALDALKSGKALAARPVGWSGCYFEPVEGTAYKVFRFVRQFETLGDATIGNVGDRNNWETIPTREQLDDVRIREEVLPLCPVRFGSQLLEGNPPLPVWEEVLRGVSMARVGLAEDTSNALLHWVLPLSKTYKLESFLHVGPSLDLMSVFGIHGVIVAISERVAVSSLAEIDPRGGEMLRRTSDLGPRWKVWEVWRESGELPQLERCWHDFEGEADQVACAAVGLAMLLNIRERAGLGGREIA